MVNHKETRTDKIDMDLKYITNIKKIWAKLFKMCKLRQRHQIFAAFSVSWTHVHSRFFAFCTLAFR